MHTFVAIDFLSFMVCVPQTKSPPPTPSSYPPQLRAVNTACFPVSYGDAFYREVVERKDEELCKFAYWNGFVVGAVCCRIEPAPDR